MSLIVQKFGGTSLADLEHIRHVADRVINTVAQGHHVVVVVSAMSGETDRLIGLAKHFGRYPEPREYAVLVSTGEQVSMALLAMALISKGQPARSYSGAQVGIRTSSNYHKARILDVECRRIHDDLRAGRVVIVAGFQGIDENDDITTLGRGGSDTTAVALAAALQADECQIYTDVDGVYTADPRLVPNATLLKQISLNEMLEFSDLGAKVLQNRAVEYASQFRVPVRVLSTFKEGVGTLIQDEESVSKEATISGITHRRHEAKINIIGLVEHPGLATQIMEPMEVAEIEIDMIIQNVNAQGTIDFAFTVSRDDYPRALEISQSIVDKLQQGEIQGDDKVAKLSVVGMGLRSHTNVVSTIFKVLGQENIDIQMISSSETKVSIVIQEQFVKQAACALHTAFGLDHEQTPS